MKNVLTLLFIIALNFLNAQDYPWKNRCENQEGLSNAEYGDCLLNSTKEAEGFYNKLYESIIQNIKSKLSKAQQNSVEFEMLKIYNDNLPKLKKALSDYANSYSEISEAQSIEGSGHTTFKLSKLLEMIEQNIIIMEKIKVDLSNL